MPIWLEVLILSMIAYILGLGIGWLVWGRANAQGD
jgi:hypothetical protein